MAIDTAAIYGPYVQRFSGSGRMARQHMNMALLAHNVNARREKLGVAGPMRRVAVHTILAYRRVFPEKRAALFGMARITKIIGRSRHKHFSRLTSVRIVAGSAADFHVVVLCTKQMCGALVKDLSLFNVARQAQFFLRSFDKQVFIRFGMVIAVATHTTQISTFMLAAIPEHSSLIARMAAQAGGIRVSRADLCRVENVFWVRRLQMSGQIAMARFTVCGPVSSQKSDALSVNVLSKRLDDFLMALLALLPCDRRAGSLLLGTHRFRASNARHTGQAQKNREGEDP